MGEYLFHNKSQSHYQEAVAISVATLVFMDRFKDIFWKTSKHLMQNVSLGHLNPDLEILGDESSGFLGSFDGIDFCKGRICSQDCRYFGSSLPNYA